MSISKPGNMGAIRDRVRSYLVGTRSYTVDPTLPAVVVRAPVETGLSRFINVENIPNLEDLPFIPERMRDFAFRYSTEYMPVKQWAKVYNCSVETIRGWLSHEGVRAYIAVCRFEQRMFNLAQHLTMQRNVYKTINTILNTKITADTIGPIVSMAKFVYQILHDPQGASDRAKGTLNVNIGYGSPPQVETDSPYAQEGNPYANKTIRNVTPKQLQALQSDIDELEIMYKVLGAGPGDPDAE